MYFHWNSSGKVHGKYAVEDNSALMKKKNVMSAGRKAVQEEGSLCGSCVQLRASVNAFSIIFCVDAIIPEFVGCMDFLFCDR